MIRLLIVLAVVALAAVYLNSNTSQGDGQTATPQAIYKEKAGDAKALEQQMQQQAASQLDAIDDGTQ